MAEGVKGGGRVAAMFIVAIFLASIIFIGLSASDPQNDRKMFREGMADLMSKDRYRNSTWSALVIDLSTGKVLYNLKSGTMMVPGSTTKLYSSTAVMQYLGTDFVTETPVYSVGVVENGHLNGTLVLKASWDLNMGGRGALDGILNITDVDHGDANALGYCQLTGEDPLAGLDFLAQQVASTGMTSADQVIIDMGAWGEQDIGKEHLVGPMAINDNLIDIVINATTVGQTATCYFRPFTSAYSVACDVVTIDSGEDIIVVHQDSQGKLSVAGQIAAGHSTVRTFTVTDPASFARTLFIEALERNGVSIGADETGANLQAEIPAGYGSSAAIARMSSVPLREDVKLTLKVSQNFHADSYIAMLSYYTGSTDFTSGMVVMKSQMDALGINTGQVCLTDGEGGSAEDRFSAQAVCQLLRQAWSAQLNQSLLDALPILGVDGSLADSATNGSEAIGHVFAKTGTRAGSDHLNQRSLLFTKALAGYVHTSRGNWVAFALFVNDVPIGSIEQMMQVGSDLGYLSELIYHDY
ncbi:MAG: D-alanyl-D-alanine carboxypeptidase/endopeptidase [Methanomassiliicoccales archaeon PtaU1.Bin124]|nr:MAG: D-alanyl-D-alanine carboxypeptidase/endopeptidase [Methanomassiliicoccales archaeon PtaU1.Bin124]